MGYSLLLNISCVHASPTINAPFAILAGGKPAAIANDVQNRLIGNGFNWLGLAQEKYKNWVRPCVNVRIKLHYKF